MSEINNKLPFKNSSLSSLVKKVESDLATYIDSGQNAADKHKREVKAITVMETLAGRIHNSGICPEGTVWDPAKRICRPVQ